MDKPMGFTKVNDPDLLVGLPSFLFPDADICMANSGQIPDHNGYFPGGVLDPDAN